MTKLSLWEQFRLRIKNRYEETTTHCLGFSLKIVDKSSFLYMFKEIFTREIYKFDTENTKPYIIDCGANVGLATIYFKSIYPSAEIVAFEPDPKIFQILKENISSAKVRGIELINKGLSNHTGEISFFSEGADGGRVATEHDTNNIIKIQTTTLSSYLNKKVDFLKIDIEGSEIDVLTECQEQLKYVDNLFVEYHSPHKNKQQLSILFTILEKNNFRYYVEQGGIHSTNPFVTIENYLDYDFQLNIFAYKI